ncbi:MAG TPA: flagellar hook protein FlgE [Candidatus Binatia bacterium]|nr:flagellar hook protein FlgE [Candidatus Binatia bacterium]
MAGDSLFIGVSGLNAQQQNIDVISNNIANVGTDGFKAQDVNFQDLLYQTSAFPTAPSATLGGTNAQQEGLGVQVASVSSDFSQGGLQTTGVNTDLAINGDGFFVLGDLAANNGVATNPVYTRDGAFSLNENGILYDPASGKAVLGYAANAAGTVTPSSSPTSLQIPIGLKSQAVGTGFGAKTGPTNDKVFDVSFGGNLDQTKYISAATPGGVAQLQTISTTIYDSLGNAHLVNVAFSPVTAASVPAGMLLPANVNNTLGSAVPAATEWSYTVSSTDGTVFTNNTSYVFFDQNGQFINTSGVGVATAASVHKIGTQPTGVAGAGDQLTVTQWGAVANTNNPINVTATPGPIGLDFSNMTSLSGASTPTTISQNGFTQGTLQNITIGQDGTITGAFSNGQSQTLAQLALATFQNEQGLLRQGGNEYTQSANSGLPQIGIAGTGRFGAIVSGALEESNVSLADQFTKMIAAQRAFQANSASITTADQDLQTVIALKR